MFISVEAYRLSILSRIDVEARGKLSLGLTRVTRLREGHEKDGRLGPQLAMERSRSRDRVGINRGPKAWARRRTRSDGQNIRFINAVMEIPFPASPEPYPWPWYKYPDTMIQDASPSASLAPVPHPSVALLLS